MLKNFWGFFGILFLLAQSFIAAAGDLPDSQSLRPWQPSFKSDLDYDSYPGYSVAQLKKNCPSFDKLYPTHPQQDLKIYSQMLEAGYNLETLSANSPACTRKSFGPRPFCLFADTAFDAILSDTFSDDCGNLYRAFRHLRFLKQNDTMGTLSSPGRTTERDFSVIEYSLYGPGPTYVVGSDTFCKIGPLLKGDSEAIQILREKATSPEGKFKFDPATKTFKER